jgi:hypothetical protein
MMAQRKDMMRIIRQDAGFSAKLGFGAVAAGEAKPTEPVLATVAAEVGQSAALTPAPGLRVALPDECDQHVVSGKQIEVRAEVGLQEMAALPRAEQATSIQSDRVATASAARGHVVYVSVSLTARQAAKAEAWAAVARCTVQFLIRRVAQGLREDVFDDWERNGMPTVAEPRGARGKHPTSVTLTLQPQFAADLAARHDPLGMLGLGRAMGPAFRARFHEAFDIALAKAKIQTTTEGDDQ